MAAQAVKSALPSHLKATLSPNSGQDDSTGRHHGKTRSHMVSCLQPRDVLGCFCCCFSVIVTVHDPATRDTPQFALSIVRTPLCPLARVDFPSIRPAHFQTIPHKFVPSSTRNRILDIPGNKCCSQYPDYRRGERYTKWLEGQFLSPQRLKLGYAFRPPIHELSGSRIGEKLPSLNLPLPVEYITLASFYSFRRLLFCVLAS